MTHVQKWNLIAKHYSRLMLIHTYAIVLLYALLYKHNYVMQKIQIHVEMNINPEQ